MKVQKLKEKGVLSIKPFRPIKMKKSYIWIVTETDWCGGYQEGCDILLKAFNDENKAIKFKEGLEQKQNEASKNYYSYSQVFSLISK